MNVQTECVKYYYCVPIGRQFHEKYSRLSLSNSVAISQILDFDGDVRCGTNKMMKLIERSEF